MTIPPKAQRDARFFIEALKKRDFATGMICVNRAWNHTMPETAPPGLPTETLEWYRSVSTSHKREIARMRNGRRLRDAKEIRVLNELERDVEGVESLRALADQLEPARTRTAG